MVSKESTLHRKAIRQANCTCLVLAAEEWGSVPIPALVKNNREKYLMWNTQCCMFYPIWWENSKRSMFSTMWKEQLMETVTINHVHYVRSTSNVRPLLSPTTFLPTGYCHHRLARSRTGWRHWRTCTRRRKNIAMFATRVYGWEHKGPKLWLKILSQRY